MRKNKKIFRKCHILAEMLLLLNFVQCVHGYVFVHDCMTVFVHAHEDRE